MRKSYYRSSSNYGWGFLIGFLAVLVVGFIGWCMNIYHLWHMTNILDTGEGVVRIVGIFIPPLGAIMGLFF